MNQNFVYSSPKVEWDPEIVPAISVRQDGKTLKFWHDGRIEWEGCTPDEAALMFARSWPEALKRAAYEHFHGAAPF